MCGRYSLSDGEDNAQILQIIREIDRKYPAGSYQTGEIFPTNTVPVLLSEMGRLVPELSVWGFPRYQGSGILINARAETAAQKQTFRDSMLERRCVIPSTGFYEWDANRKKHLFRLPGEQVLYMAGLYQNFDGVRRYVILTVPANESLKGIHFRMPVVLMQENLERWTLDTDAALKYLHMRMPALEHSG